VSWLQKHSFLVFSGVLGALLFAVFTWSERGYFCDQAKDHKSPCGSFWSSEHLHDWVYNAFSNYQSEMLIAVFLVLMLKKGASEGDREKDKT
jgi:hypothetical protein